MILEHWPSMKEAPVDDCISLAKVLSIHIMYELVMKYEWMCWKTRNSNIACRTCNLLQLTDYIFTVQKLVLSIAHKSQNSLILLY